MVGCKVWAQVKTAPNIIIAEMWKELFEGEGIPTRILPAEVGGDTSEVYRVFVPKSKTQVIEEILRKV